MRATSMCVAAHGRPGRGPSVAGVRPSLAGLCGKPSVSPTADSTQMSRARSGPGDCGAGAVTCGAGYIAQML